MSGTVAIVIVGQFHQGSVVGRGAEFPVHRVFGISACADSAGVDAAEVMPCADGNAVRSFVPTAAGAEHQVVFLQFH